MSTRKANSIYGRSNPGGGRSSRVEKPTTRSSTRKSIVNMKLFPTSLSVDTKAPGRTRAKVPLESRKRNPIACEQCRSRKIKCESSTPGEPPCKQCEKTGSDCRFGDLSPKVVVPKNDLLLLKSRCEALEKCILDTSTEAQLQELRNVLMSLPMEGVVSSFEDDNGTGTSSSSTHSGSRRQKAEFSGLSSEEERSPSDKFAYHGLESTSDKLFYDNVQQLMNRDAVGLGLNGLPYSSLFPTLSPYRAIGQTTSSSYPYLPYPPCTANDVYMVDKPVVSALVRVFNSTVGAIGGDHLQSNGGKPTTCFDFNNPFQALNCVGATGDEKRNIDMIYATLNVVLAIGAQTVAIATQPEGDGINKAQGWSILDPNTFLDDNLYHDGSNSAQMVPIHIQPSIFYISKARFLLGNPLEAVRSIPTIQCLTLMGIYYWTIGCPEESYQYIGVADRIAVSCGFFDPKRVLSMSEEEKEIFHNLIIFERMINNLMGTPSMLPAVEQTTTTTLKTAHIRLLGIAGDFTAKLAEVSQARSLAGLQYINYADNALNALHVWRARELAEFEQARGLTGPNRSMMILYLQYYQQVLLFSRPSVLSIVQHSFGITTYPVHQTAYNHLDQSLKAARTIMTIVKQSTYTSFLEIQAITNAVMILSLGQLTTYSDPQDMTEVQEGLGILKRCNHSQARELSQLTEDILRVCITIGKLPATTDISQVSAALSVSGILASTIPAVSLPMTSSGTEADFAARAAATAAAAGMPLEYTFQEGNMYSWQ